MTRNFIFYKNIRVQTFLIGLSISILTVITAFKLPIYKDSGGFGVIGSDTDTSWVRIMKEVKLEKEKEKKEGTGKKRDQNMDEFKLTEKELPKDTEDNNFELIDKKNRLFTNLIETKDTSSIEALVRSNKSEIVHFPHIRASFPGGEKALMTFVRSNFIYSPEAVKMGIEGNIHVSFVVTRDGRISDINILKGLDPDLDDEAKRVINKMPRWEPAYVNGEAVNSRFVMPVKLILE